jgi:hypothetical protein
MTKAMQMKAPWRYVVPFTNAAGEHRTILVRLSEFEQLDAAGQRIPGPGGFDGLVARSYALRRACPLAPPGFEPVIECIEFVAAVHSWATLSSISSSNFEKRPTLKCNEKCDGIRETMESN